MSGAGIAGTMDEAYKRFKLPLVPFSCVTTANGNAAGTTIISSQLIGIAAVVMNSCAIIITAGAYLGFKAPVMAFDTTTGGLTLGDPMGAVIAAGTRFAIVPAEAVSVDIALDDTLVFVGVCSAGMTGSTTTIVCPDMVGKWADDFFNTDWLAIVLLNSNSVGNAPEGERRDITNYVSATGTFTTQAFTANVEAGDVIMFVRREIVAGMIAQGMFYLGQCNAGMTGSTGTIVSADLAGFDDDFFNTDYVMVVILDASAAGSAPEGEVRDITNYVGATGTFTTAVFSGNVEALDWVLVARREFFVVDGVALKTTPITNSLAYRISQFISTGDGDFAGSTPLPSNISLFDILARTGDPAFPAAAKAANDVSHAEVLRYISDEQIGEEYDGEPDIYDTLITGWTGAASPVAVGALIERLQLLQLTLINANTIFTPSAATVNTVTCAALVDRADLYEGMMLVPITGDQAGQGRYITAYDGNDILTVVPDWSTDPDAGAAMTFVIMPTPMKFAYEAGKGMSAIYDLVNGIPVMTRIYNDYDIAAEDNEYTIFEFDDAAYIWHPEWLEWHLDEMLASDTIRVRVYVKDNDTEDNELLIFNQTYTGVQATPVQYIQLPPVDLYLKVTVEQIDIDTAVIDVLFKLYKKS